MTSDDKKARVELPEVGIQIFQTLKEKPEQDEKEKVDLGLKCGTQPQNGGPTTWFPFPLKTKETTEFNPPESFTRLVKSKGVMLRI